MNQSHPRYYLCPALTNSFVMDWTCPLKMHMSLNPCVMILRGGWGLGKKWGLDKVIRMAMKRVVSLYEEGPRTLSLPCERRGTEARRGRHLDLNVQPPELREVSQPAWGILLGQPELSKVVSCREHTACVPDSFLTWGQKLTFQNLKLKNKA